MVVFVAAGGRGDVECRLMIRLVPVVLLVAAVSATADSPACLPDCRGADLAGVDLRGVDLPFADFRRADLAGANLRDAVLIGADLRGANLNGADLSDARFNSSRPDLSLPGRG